MNKLYPNAKKLMTRNPAKIGTVAGHRYYEHPDYGDETYLLCVTPDGKLKHSAHWELPESYDVLAGDI
ncbi:MAG: hypothetical protein GY800_13785 [Planctomycetes bacterium]|nr:hypothetical protein [Planctomycetota bacterium]